jgi:hypothetical protein
MNGQRVAREVHAAEAPEEVARAGARDGDLRPLLGEVGGVHLPGVPLGLEPVLHVAWTRSAPPVVVWQSHASSARRITTPSSDQEAVLEHIRP